ncbi:septum formation family protein [Nonomuraea sp. NPDC050547]|uniref:septum formation family protein n=1 Tax=unclassified Nonomuraea TaxID=2593643 RepID=UPI00379C9650
MRSLLAAAALLAATACSASTTPPSASPQRAHAAELRTGDCFDEIAQDGSATPVPCENPHAYELAGVWVLPDEPWPGEEEVITRATEGCEEKVKIKKEFQDTVTWTAFSPTQETWPKQRTAYCVALSVEEGVKLTGHVLG